MLRPALDESWEEIGSGPAWAVFFSYYHDTKTTHIHEVVPWDSSKHRLRSGLVKVRAVDELGAYKIVVREMREQAK